MQEMFEVDDCSGTSVQQQVTMSRHQSAEIFSIRSICRIRSSRSKHREVARDAKQDVALLCLRVLSHRPN